MKVLHKLTLVLVFSALTLAVASTRGTALDKENILYIDTKNGRIAQNQKDSTDAPIPHASSEDRCNATAISRKQA